MVAIHDLVRRRRGVALRWRLRREGRRLAGLAGEGGRGAAAGARPLARALEAAAHHRPDAEARAWFKRIETERRRLEASQQPLSGGSGTTSTVGQVTRTASVPRGQASLLFNLVRTLDARRCLEMGTCVGISGAYLAAAMASRDGAELLSLEGYKDRAEVARQVWRRLGFENTDVVVGRFKHTLQDALDTGPFDVAFVDGHHDEAATVDYVTLIRKRCRQGALLILDDIDWSDGMRSAWRFLEAELSGSTISDLGHVGLIRLGPNDAGRE